MPGSRRRHLSAKHPVLERLEPKIVLSETSYVHPLAVLELAKAYSGIGVLLKQTGDLAGALAEYRKCLEIFRALVAEHPKVPNYRRELPVSHDWVGNLLTLAGKAALAMAELDQARSLLEALA
jgi:tetratricopeptide (TPR) repeat protein